MTSPEVLLGSGSATRWLALGAMLLVIGGCSVARMAQATPDAFAGWSTVPLAPDPALTARVVRGETACNLDPASGPMRILVQDRRTQQTAAFLVASTTRFGSCTVTGSGGASSGGSDPMPEAMTGPLTIDDNGHGGLGGGDVWELGGRVAPGAARVTVQLADGREVVTSQANGYWLAWWPFLGPAVRVIATDASGNEIANLEVPR